MTIEGYQNSQVDRENLINKHVELVRRIAFKIHGRVGQYAEVDDLIQYGVIGLIEAANNYSNIKDGAFPNYASVRIKGAIIDHLRRSSSLSRQNIKKHKQISAAKDDLRRILGHEPNTDQLAAKLKISARELLRWESQISAGHIQSIDDFFHETSVQFSSDEMSQDFVLDQKLRAKILSERLAELEANQALVLQLYFVEELNTYEIAEILELSPGRVSQIKSTAFKVLRDKLGKDF
ncbi:MAG: FliA/WhiG family RNA polymerase sigma factor [Pseudomonadota bacterium]|nr:FliA/WhiG family RNA polymerase sigma factor [Pseudomonadota bacterium]